MSGQRKRRTWTMTEENALRDAWGSRPTGEKAVTFGRKYSAKLLGEGTERSSESICAKRQAMGLRVSPPKVRVCHGRTVGVCDGPTGDRGGGVMCCNCAEGFDLPDIRVELVDS